MNNGNFAGHVGRDAELKSLPSGQTVLEFPLAVNIGSGDKKRTLWVDCKVWGERGEKLFEYVLKGKGLAVSGDIDVRAYTRNDGEIAAVQILNVQRLTFIGGGNKDEGKQQQSSAPRQRQAAPAQQRQDPASAQPDFNDDIPF